MFGNPAPGAGPEKGAAAMARTIIGTRLEIPRFRWACFSICMGLCSGRIIGGRLLQGNASRHQKARHSQIHRISDSMLGRRFQFMWGIRMNKVSSHLIPVSRSFELAFHRGYPRGKH